MERAAKKKTSLPPGFVAKAGKALFPELAPIASSIYQCMDLQCMCSYVRGRVESNGQCRLPNNQILKKAVRKEIRMMTDDERQRYFSAIRTLKQNGEYDGIARLHKQSTVMGGAHSGPAFLPWHREYIKRFEFAIRQIDPTLALPYWDSTLDGALARPTDSVLFSSELGGNTNPQGFVNSGPFTNWQTLEGQANIKRAIGAKGSPMKESEIDFVMQQNRIDQVLAFSSPRPGQANIKRAIGAKGSPMKESEIDFVMQQNRIDQVLAFSSPRPGCPYRTDYNCLEYTHGSVHIFIGGDMFDTSTSANDPLFFLHHSFIDFIWEMWRQQRQNRAEREILYPPDNQLCASSQHFAASPMNPFAPMRNIDGLSNKYTDNLYEYAPRPTCSQSKPDCGSRYLFCDLTHGQPKCSAKIRMGAVCYGYTRGENPCYNGACVSGRCMRSRETIETTTSFTIQTNRPAVVTPQETCFNENECCASWSARDECRKNPGYMNVWCKASCGICQPHYRLVDDCSDRHTNCELWYQAGECTRNALWMTENCRKSCRKCSQSRAKSCGEWESDNDFNNDDRGQANDAGNDNADRGLITTSTQIPEQVCQNTEGCYNENACCPHWSLFGECSKSPVWMSCNCRVSCGYCVPIDYNYGSCSDYHQQCSAWARLGECEKNQWMLENCRASCRTCYSQWDLRKMCRGPVGSTVAPPKNRRVHQNQGFIWQNGDWEQVRMDYDDWDNVGLTGWVDGGRRWRLPPLQFPPFGWELSWRKKRA
ncbi:shTK domain protein [Dictyocaulus viviparus]|uniref:ShTK domain protein n=1 Tax=Dictyocaulus viviparus TaxID=29172 RepID=A0A0D8Y9Y2_DICVI|nr:shTK domain protein [Dictyocaulus viviparus]